MTAITFTARKIADAGKARSQCAVIPLFSDKKPGGAARLLDKASAGAVSAALALGDFSGKAGQSLLLPGSGNNKVLRGGSRYYSGVDLRSADRYIGSPGHRLDYVGFRCVVSPGE